MKEDKEGFIQKSDRFFKWMQRHVLMLFSIVWVIASAVLLWLVLDKIIDRMDFVLAESVLVASFCFIVIAKLMRKYRKKSASLFIDHFSSLCVSIATILTGAGAMICVGIQLYQGLTYHKKVQEIENMYRHINDIYYGMLTTNAYLMYSDSTRKHQAFETQLRGLDKALKVKVEDTAYYGAIDDRLLDYLKGVEASSFSEYCRDKTLERIDQYRYRINYLFGKVEKAERYDDNIRDKIDPVKRKFNDRIDSLRNVVESQKENISSGSQH